MLIRTFVNSKFVRLLFSEKLTIALKHRLPERIYRLLQTLANVKRKNSQIRKNKWKLIMLVMVMKRITSIFQYISLQS